MKKRERKRNTRVVGAIYLTGVMIALLLITISLKHMSKEEETTKEETTRRETVKEQPRETEEEKETTSILEPEQEQAERAVKMTMKLVPLLIALPIVATVIKIITRGDGL